MQESLNIIKNNIFYSSRCFTTHLVPRTCSPWHLHNYVLGTGYTGGDLVRQVKNALCDYNVCYRESLLCVNILLQGDSGGPLVSQTQGGRWAAVGLVSWRTAAYYPGGGCSGDTYTVFTEISKYLSWIALQEGLLPPLGQKVFLKWYNTFSF